MEYALIAKRGYSPNPYLANQPQRLKVDLWLDIKQQRLQTYLGLSECWVVYGLIGWSRNRICGVQFEQIASIAASTGYVKYHREFEAGLTLLGRILIRLLGT